MGKDNEKMVIGLKKPRLKIKVQLPPTHGNSTMVEQTSKSFFIVKRIFGGIFTSNYGCIQSNRLFTCRLANNSITCEFRLSNAKCSVFIQVYYILLCLHLALHSLKCLCFFCN